MTKDYLRGQGFVKEPKVENELGVGKDGMQQGGIPVEMTNPAETQEAEVQGQGNILAEKKRKAKWY